MGYSMAIGSLHVGFPLAVAAVVTTGYVTSVVWRQRRAPTALALFGVVLALFLSALTQLAVFGPLTVSIVPLGDPDALWLGLAYAFTILGAGFWVLFTVQYTGRGSTFTPLVAGVIAFLWLLFFLNAFVAHYYSLVDTNDAFTIASVLGGGVFYLSAFVVVGVFLVLETALRRNAVPVREATLLSGGALVFVFTPAVAGNFGQPLVIPVCLFVASVFFTVAIERYPLFEQLPVARLAGRDRLLEELEAAVVVVDREQRVNDLNPAAETLFETTRASARGKPLEDVLTASVDPPARAATAEPTTHQLSSDLVLSITANPVTDELDRLFGYVLVCRDVTERTRRERRLRVLNGLLVGGIRDQMDTVAEHAATVSAGEEPAEVGAEIRSTTAVAKALVAKTRTLERALATASTADADVKQAVNTVVSQHERADLAPLVQLPVDAVSAGIDETVLETILEWLVRDASEHARTRLEITVTDDGQPTVRIGDDRPPEATRSLEETRATEVTGDTQTQRAFLIDLVSVALEHGRGTVSVSTTDEMQYVTLELPPVTDTRQQANSHSRGEAA